ncbi:MAG: hypothetical protein WA885_08585 [Phormidesmis sp.]
MDTRSKRDESETSTNKEATIMMTMNKSDSSELQFEEFRERADIKVSQALTTSKGDKIRAVMTTGGSVMLVAVEKDDGDTITVIGSPDSIPAELLGEIWDGIKSIVGKAIDIIKGCTPKTVTQVNVGKGGKITSITTTTTCVPN